MGRAAGERVAPQCVVCRASHKTKRVAYISDVSGQLFNSGRFLVQFGCEMIRRDGSCDEQRRSPVGVNRLDAIVFPDWWLD